MTYLQEMFKKLGATDQQANSSVIKLVEKAMVEDSEFCQKVAADAIERIAQTFEKAQASEAAVKAAYENAMLNARADARRAVNDIAVERSKYEDAVKHAKDLIIDTDLAEAVKAYKAVLTATKEVFGEQITPDVMAAAIQAGSYTAWRGIMGPKEEKNDGWKRVK